MGLTFEESEDAKRINPPVQTFSRVDVVRVVVDLASVRDTARLLSAVSDEYDRVAARLQGGYGLSGVTGPHRGHMAGVVASVARQLRSVASTHRTLATDLQRRVSVAERPGTSPLHSGLSLSAARFTEGGAGIPIDRDGDGVAEAMAFDRDGDGFYETFVVDTNADGTYDLMFVMDRSNNLQAAAYDGDGDGFAESFIADTPGGVVRLRDTNRDGYHDHVTRDSPAPQSRSRVVVNPQATPGYSLFVTAGARPAPQTLSVTYNPSAATRPTLQYSPAGSQGRPGLMVNPNARPNTFIVHLEGQDPVHLPNVPIPNEMLYALAKTPRDWQGVHMVHGSGHDLKMEWAERLNNHSGIDQPELGHRNTYNPLLSPYDSDGDGYTDGIDRYPNDPFRR